MRHTDIDISLSGSRDFHGDDVRANFVIDIQLQRATRIQIAGINGERVGNRIDVDGSHSARVDHIGVGVKYGTLR
jgi:hypothetical protein